MAPSPDPRPTVPASDEALAAPHRGYVGFSWAKFNETAIPILLVGLITGLMLFNFNETSDRMTRLEDRITRLEDRITRLEENIDARFAKLEDDIDARFTKLEENQQEIAVTLARLVALLEASDEAQTNPSG